MYLEKLEIHGFKSFAKPTELVFNSELTAIVGPNGTGKSNISDAVRWVLGEQSSKALRGKKAEDVIFAGSDKKARLSFARVDLFLNNRDHQADIDYEQIIITRKVNRNGESEYFINNNKVRLLDVQLLLAKANFGQKTYSIIGQGMIDSILTASAQERREFFDEATGVKQFQIKKEQSINKLTNAKSNLKQADQILLELEPRLRSLARQVKKLEKREKLDEELRDIQTEYYSFLSNNLKKELKASQSKFAELQKEVSDLNQQLVELQTQLEKEEKTLSRQESFQLLQDKLSHAQSELNSLLKEKAILEGQIDLKLISKGRSDLVWYKKQAESLKSDINKNKLLLAEKVNSLRVLESEFSVLEKKRKDILRDFKELEEKVLNGNTDHFSIGELSDKLSNILKKQQEFQKDLNHVNNLDGLVKLKKTCGYITSEITKLFQEIKYNKGKDRAHWQKEFNKLLISKDNLVAEVNEARTKIALVKSESARIEELIDKDKIELSRLESSQAEESGLDDYKNQLSELEEKIQIKNKALKEIEGQIKSFNKEEEKKKETLVEVQKKFREVQHNFNIKNNELNEVKVELARLETKEEDLNKEISEEIPDLKTKEVSQLNLEGVKQRINNLKNQLQIIGGIDQSVVAEYEEVNERYQFLKEQSADLTEAIKHLEKVIKDLDSSISSQFDKSFKNINKLFNKYFKKLFNGGKAELVLNITETKEPLSAEDTDEAERNEDGGVKITRTYGIDIKALPPGKKLSSINLLSGGEKALTSIALICAIIANNPSPFVVLDEVDAALDEANSFRFVEILDELSAKTQFIAITHNRATMHKAKIIYGVTMGDDGISRLLSISFAEAEEIVA